eukprot:gene18649-biopygen9968
MTQKHIFRRVTTELAAQKHILPDLHTRACRSTYCGTCNPGLAKAHTATLVHKGLTKQILQPFPELAKAHLRYTGNMRRRRRRKKNEVHRRPGVEASTVCAGPAGPASPDRPARPKKKKPAGPAGAGCPPPPVGPARVAKKIPAHFARQFSNFYKKTSYTG